jgi:hypothetical protein
MYQRCGRDSGKTERGKTPVKKHEIEDKQQAEL